MKWTKAAPKAKAKAKACAAKKVQAKRKAMAKATPARGSAGPASSAATSAPVVEQAVTSEAFCLDSFIEQVWQIGGYTPTGRDAGRALNVAGSCSGTGAFEYTLNKMLKALKSKANCIFGCEWDRSAVQWLLRNKRAPKCIYEAGREITEDASLQI